ncbi:hypothetical protein XA68_17530 [Ophiocordyceps unilateralis]|uniref:Uncharacterized protein n=1 Tax=Ophiocordyceps unilateralis TaxID=268505 RepID=A0A2A9P331_OPHUN|nr:hypothetical protein XA68_17530 [Ophiocordyceps unilateralis]
MSLVRREDSVCFSQRLEADGRGITDSVCGIESPFSRALNRTILATADFKIKTGEIKRGRRPLRSSVAPLVKEPTLHLHPTSALVAHHDAVSRLVRFRGWELFVRPNGRTDGNCLLELAGLNL